MTSTPRTAFILQIHKNPDQVNKFINQLISEGHADVFIHIDKRNKPNLSGEILGNPNIRILENSINCEWGDISQVNTTILLLREVLASKEKYDFVCLRSGQDLLVRDRFKDFLLDHKGKVFMTLRDVNKDNLGLMEINWPKMTRKRYTTAHPYRIYRRIIQSLYRKGMNIFPNKNKWPDDYSLYNGSQWFSIPLEVASYIIDFIDRNEWYYKFFEHTLCPDEWFFHTLIMNSHYKTRVVNANFTFLKWGEKFSERSSPQYLTNEDIKAIEESGHYFARKFDEDIDHSIVDYFANKAKFGSSTLSEIDQDVRTLV
ncbi:hypothetical protein KHA96_17820 [Bacillus sp. FJAT-49711]|uniref:beta-1,6-N-acetylglucosaminyltransferase n=1 Tax=Bacillus sp. FJAT-49711 TaxID=2833585 RepID=UPI001BC91498|nr:beta-1,6-N-acetylglucosaminyltransferase [Bacillus sp. FJAT-49711]MBS4220162.1 hypothetical protein [Bacillus sp. FJAT-49711]